MRVPCLIARWAGGSAVLLLVATLVPSVSLAQSISDTTSIGAPYDRMASSLSRRVSEGSTIRVMLRSRTLVCRSPRFTLAGIDLSSSGPGAPGDSTPTLLPWQEVDRIDVRGSSAGTGAIVGGVMVGLLAAATGAAGSSDQFLEFNGGEVLALTAMGAAIGASLGALIGASTPRWKNVYRRGAPAGRIGHTEADRASESPKAVEERRARQR